MAAKKDTDQKPADDPKVDEVPEAVDAKTDAYTLDPEERVEQSPSEAEAEAEADRATATDQQSEAKRSGFMPALIGGVIAAALGFAAGRSDLLWPAGSDPSEAIAALETKVSDQAQQLADLSKQLSAVPDTSAEIAALSAKLTPIEGDLSALKSNVDDLSGKVDPLAQRVAQLEARPLTDAASPETVAAVEAELKKLQDSLAAQRAEVEKMVAEAQTLDAQAQARAQAAENLAVLSKIQGQLDAGAPYADLVTQLQTGGVQVPEALSAPAGEGVPTLTDLRESFAPAARTALADAREADKGTGLVAFLQRQTGARSVSPKDGNDPDAILSRAEGALGKGDISTALTELGALPEAAQPAMAEWIAAAKSRQSAVEAANALVTSVNSN